MANRSYLYASDLVPSRNLDPSRRRMTGISEWNYDIPIAYKLLMSGNPKSCVSSIWKIDQQIAIVGDYNAGLRRLTEFLGRIQMAQIQPFRDEAIRFLSSEENRRQYFVLECGEIFDMQGEDLAAQNDALVKELQSLNPPLPQTADVIEAMGLGNWSNILYFDINDPE